MARLVADLDASRASRAARGLHAELGKLGAEAKVLDARFSQAEVGSQKYARATIHLQRALKRGVIDQKEHDRLLGIAKEKYGQAALGAEKWGAALQRNGRQISDLGGQLTRLLTIPIAAVGAGSIKLASDFESSFAGVRKTVQATGAEFAILAQGMRDLSKEIPVNVNELNKIGESAGQLGIKKDNILAFTRVIADLSVTTNLASEEAATMLARFDNITTGGAQKTFREIGSTVVALGNNLATTEREIVEMALRLSGTGAQIGLTQADILSLAGALSSLGLEAEAGGTAFSRVMVEMQNAVLDGGKALRLFTEVAGPDFADVFAKDAALAINQFIGGLARMSEEGRNINPVLDELGLGGIRVSDALRRTGNAVGRVSEAVSLGRQAWADNNALTTEAAERYKTFESQLTIFWNRLKDVGIELGTALLPVLRDVLDIAEPGIDLFAGWAKEFANLSTPVKVATLGVAGLAAAIGPLLFVTGQLITAWGTLAAFSPRLAGALGAVVSPVGLLTAAIAALGLVAYEAIERWRRASEEGIADIIAANDRARESVRLLKEEMASGVVLGRTFEDAISSSARLGLEIQKVEEDVRSAQRQLEETDWSKFAPDQAYIRQQKLRKSIAEGSEAISNLQSELVVVDGALARVGETTIKWDEAISGSGGSSGGGGGGGGGLTGGVTTLTDAVKQHTDEIRKAEQRIRSIEQAYSDFIGALDNARKAYDGLDIPEITSFLEAQGQAIPTTAEGWRDLAQAIDEVERSLDEIGMHRNTIEPPDAVPVGNAELDWTEALDRMTAESKEAHGAMAKAAEAMMDEAWRNIQGIAAESIASIFDNYINTGSDAIDQVLKSFLRMLAELLVAWAANAAKRILLEQAVGAASGVSGGGGGGGFSWASIAKLFGGSGGGGGAAITGVNPSIYGVTMPTASAPSGTSSLMAGGALGALAIVGVTAAFAYWAHTEAAKKAAKRWFGVAEVRDGWNAIFGSVEVVNFTQGIVDIVKDVFATIGGDLASLPKITVDVRATGKEFRSFVDSQLVGVFKTYEEAFEAAALEAIKQSDLSRMIPEIAAALNAGTIHSIEQLQGVAEVFATIGQTLDPTGAAVDAFNAQIEEMGRVLDAAGISRTVLAEFEAAGWQAMRDQITGVQKSAQQLFNEQMESFNRKLEAEKALQQAALATAKAEEAAAQAEIARLTALVAGLQALAFLTDKQAQMLAGLMQNLAAANALLAASAAAAAAAQAAIDALPDPIKPSEFRGGADGGAGSRKADREQLEDMLHEHELSKLSDLARAYEEVNSKWDDAIKLAHGDAEAIERIARARQEEIQAINQQAVEDFYGRLLKFEAGSRSPLGDALSGVNQEARELRDLAKELAEALGFADDRLKVMLDRIKDAAQAQRKEILDQASTDTYLQILDFLGQSEEAERVRFEIQKAGLMIAYAELQAAAEKYNLEIKFLEELGVLVGELADLDFEGWQKLHVATPTIDRFERATDSAADAAKAMADRLAQAKVSIGEFLASLDRGDLGGVSTMGGLAAAQEQFDEIVRQARGGNIQALEAFPEVSQNLLNLARKAFASSPEFQDIFRLVREAGLEFLGISRVTQDNVIFDERFLTGQQQQTSAIQMGSDRTTNAVHAGAERTAGAVEEGARRTIEAINRQGERTSEGLREMRDSVATVLAGQQRRRGAA